MNDCTNIGLVNPQSLPRISVVIPTRDRGDAVLRPIRSLLDNTYPNYEVIVVDQSDTDLTRDAVRHLDNRIRYVKSGSKGVSYARNEGMQNTSSDYVGFVDDDCAVASDWLAQLITALSTSPNIGIAFGNVHPAEYDTSQGVIPGYVRRDSFLTRSIADKNQVEGISACMGTTRAAWSDTHGFDPMLGVGSKFGSGAEGDYAIRVLLSGYQVYETPKLQVTHYGFRSWQQRDELVGRYWYGTGAMFSKHVKNAEMDVVKLLLGLAIRWCRGERSRSARSYGRGSMRLSQLSSFSRGFFAGMRAPIDAAKKQFISSRELASSNSIGAIGRINRLFTGIADRIKAISG